MRRSTLDPSFRAPKPTLLGVAILALSLLPPSSTAQSFRFGWRNLLTTGVGVSETAVAQAPDHLGNLFVLYNVGSGFQQDCVLRKYSPLGVQLWSTTFEVAPGASRPDDGMGLAVDAAGNPYASVAAPINSSVPQACVVRFNGATGAMVYTRVFASGAAAFYPRRIAIDSAGSILQAGGYGMNGRERFAILKRSPATGALLWSRVYRPSTTSADTEALSLAVAPNRDIVVGGYTKTATGGKDALVAKFRGIDGVPLWFHVISGTGFGGDFVTALLVDTVGDVYASGETYLSGSTTFAFTRKLRGTNGTRLWQNTVNTPSNNQSSVVGVLRSPDGSIMVGGTFWGVNPRPDLFVQKLNPTTGAQVFLRLVNGVADSVEEAAGFALDRFGNGYIAGSSVPFGSNKLREFLVARVSKTGVIDWQYRYAPGFSTTYDDSVKGVLVENLTGHVYVIGDAVPNINTDGKVLGLYQAPLAVADTYGVAKNKLFDSGIPGVMANDVWRLTCTTTLVTPPAQGALTLQTNGRFTYLPPANFTGTVTFRYRINRVGLRASEALVTLKVL